MRLRFRNSIYLTVYSIGSGKIDVCTITPQMRCVSRGWVEVSAPTEHAGGVMAVSGGTFNTSPWRDTVATVSDDVISYADRVGLVLADWMVYIQCRASGGDPNSQVQRCSTLVHPGLTLSRRLEASLRITMQSSVHFDPLVEIDGTQTSFESKVGHRLGRGETEVCNNSATEGTMRKMQ